MKKIQVSMPLNLTADERILYEPYKSYTLSKINVKTRKNIFVSFSGFCMDNKGLIKECHHEYPLQISDYINEVSQYYYSAMDDPSNLITLDNEYVYLSVHHPWFNYYHWICESIFRLWMVRDQLKQMTLLLPDYYRHADFIMGSLRPFNIKHIFFIPNGKSLMVRRLCIPQLKPICDSYDQKKLKEVSRFYKEYVETEYPLPPKIDKLYVSRELASRRKIINELDVQKVLKKYGFTIFHPEKHAFLEQVAIFSRVDFLVGAHGSGLTNLLFMNENSSILELHQVKTNELDHPSPLFWYMADALGINYYHQLCSPYGKVDYFEGDYLVDIDLLELNIANMLENAS